MNRFYSMLGIARKAKSLALGHAACQDALKHNKVQGLIVAVDAASNTIHLFEALAITKGVDFLKIGTQEQLGLAVGKGPHAVIAILDKGLKNKLWELSSQFDFSSKTN